MDPDAGIAEEQITEHDADAGVAAEQTPEHGSEQETKAEMKDGFICPQCKQSFSSKLHLVAHFESHQLSRCCPVSFLRFPKPPSDFPSAPKSAVFILSAEDHQNWELMEIQALTSDCEIISTSIPQATPQKSSVHGDIVDYTVVVHSSLGDWSVLKVHSNTR
jgi:hypothetical protein